MNFGFQKVLGFVYGFAVTLMLAAVTAVAQTACEGDGLPGTADGCQCAQVACGGCESDGCASGVCAYSSQCYGSTTAGTWAKCDPSSPKSCVVTGELVGGGCDVSPNAAPCRLLMDCNCEWFSCTSTVNRTLNNYIPCVQL